MTDDVQVGDTVANAPFKKYVATEYKNWLLQNYQEAQEQGIDFATWQPDLSQKNMKPKIIHFIRDAIVKMNTPQMAASIQHGFRKHSFIDRMYSEEEQAKARAKIEQETENSRMMAEDIIITIEENDELNDEDVEDIGHDGDDAFGDNAIVNVEAAAQRLPKRVKFI